MDGLILPRSGPGVCRRCFNFTREPAGELCRACRQSGSNLRAMVPVSYAPAGGQLHRDLADYKRAAEPAVPDLVSRLARLLSRHLAAHEQCVLRAAGIEAFDCIAVVPSGSPRRDVLHPLRHIVRDLVPEARWRYRDLLRASGDICTPHAFAPQRFEVREDPHGARVLLIDDVWTTGATAQSAAAALMASGATNVSAVVVGRYVNGYWGGINARLTRLAAAQESEQCALCAGSAGVKSDGDPLPRSPSDGLPVGSRSRPG